MHLFIITEITMAYWDSSACFPKIKYKLDKLFGDECYSSAKIEALGFRAKKTLKDMNKTSF